MNMRSVFVTAMLFQLSLPTIVLSEEIQLNTKAKWIKHIVGKTVITPPGGKEYFYADGTVKSILKNGVEGIGKWWITSKGKFCKELPHMKRCVTSIYDGAGTLRVKELSHLRWKILPN